jgi:hypothetical protein
MEQATQRSWLGRNWKWLVPCGCLSVILLVVVVCGGMVGVLFASIRSSWACTEGVDLARRNQAVAQELGQPIEGGWMVSGSVHVSDGSGDADLTIPLSGPKGNGTLYVVAKKSEGQWSLEKAVVITEKTQSKIDLLKK